MKREEEVLRDIIDYLTAGIRIALLVRNPRADELVREMEDQAIEVIKRVTPEFRRGNEE